HDPVRVPRLAAIRRRRLLPARRCRCDVRPQEPRARFTVLCLVAKEGADSVLEPAFDWRVERTRGIASIEPPDSPLFRLRIIRAHRYGAISAIGRMQRVLLHVCPAVHEPPIAARALEVHPFLTVRFQAMMMHTPFADEKIKIVRASAAGGS